MSQETTASTTAELEEELTKLEEPDLIFEAQMKQALKLSRREAREWQAVKRRRRVARPVLSLDDPEDSEDAEELAAAIKASVDEQAAAAAEQQAQVARDGTSAERRKNRHSQPSSNSVVVELSDSESEKGAVSAARASRQLSEAAAGAGMVSRSEVSCGAAVLNTEQQAALNMLLVAAQTTKVVGPAGTGKTRVAEAFFEAVAQRDERAELLWIAPYNSQVDSTKERARCRPQLWGALQNGKRIKTAARVFMFPMVGQARRT